VHGTSRATSSDRSETHRGRFTGQCSRRRACGRRRGRRISSGGAGGPLEVRAGSATGTLLGKATVPVTGGWENVQDVTAHVSRARRGTTSLHLVLNGGTGNGALFDVDDFTFTTG